MSVSFKTDMDIVALRMPASVHYVRLARLVSADAGSRAGLDYEEIEDLKIAVTELCHALMGDGAYGDLTLDFRTDAGEVSVRGRSAHPGRPSVNEFAEIILQKVADEHSVRSDGEARTFDVVKRRRSATSPSSP
jgi:serine/threonine-protein kinase RsbW